MKLSGPSPLSHRIQSSGSPINPVHPKARTGLQQDTVSFSRRPVQFSGGEVTYQDVKALQEELPTLLLGSIPEGRNGLFDMMFDSKCQINSVGIGEVVPKCPALGITSLTEEGRDTVVERILNQPGAKVEPNLKVTYNDAAKIISLPFKEKQIPIYVEVNRSIARLY